MNHGREPVTDVSVFKSEIHSKLTYFQVAAMNIFLNLLFMCKFQFFSWPKFTGYLGLSMVMPNLLPSISQPFYIEPNKIQPDAVGFSLERRSMDSTRAKAFNKAIAKYKTTRIKNNFM